MKSLGAVSSIPHVSSHDETDVQPQPDVWGGEAAPSDSDWRYWFNRAYRAWLARSEQLCLFEEWVA